MDDRKRKRVERLLKNSQIKDPMVSLEVIMYVKQRKLDESLVQKLATCSCILQEVSINLINKGKCRTGKIWLAKALSKQTGLCSLDSNLLHSNQ